MQITYTPTGINDFHNRGPITLRISGHTQEGCYLISPLQERRISKHFCGVKDCHCPHGAVVEFGPDYYALQPGWVEASHV